MNRQLFLHHYLPAHLMSTLIAGVAFNFIFSDTVNYPISVPGPNTRRRPKVKAEVPKKMVIGVLVTLVAVVAGFVFISPLTYGSPGLDVEAINRRRILDTWTLVSGYFLLL